MTITITYMLATGEIRSYINGTLDPPVAPEGQGLFMLDAATLPPDFMGVGPEFFKIQNNAIVLGDPAGLAAKRQKISTSTPLDAVQDEAIIEDTLRSASDMTVEQFIAMSDRDKWTIVGRLIKGFAGVVEKNNLTY